MFWVYKYHTADFRKIDQYTKLLSGGTGLKEKAQ
jgi:hypothetical protein